MLVYSIASFFLGGGIAIALFALWVFLSDWFGAGEDY